MRTTIVYSPHPDDETLRLSGYVTFCAARGDRLILVAVTDGGSTGLIKEWGWTSPMMMAHRKLEQENAWTAASNGTGQIIRLGISDGSVSANVSVITAKAVELDKQYGPDVEHYAACTDSDYHPDHKAVITGLRAAPVRVIRSSASPEDASSGGNTYLPPAGLGESNARLARDAYKAIGWRSVPDLFTTLDNNRGLSSILR